jgi:hypothetical protein
VSPHPHPLPFDGIDVADVRRSRRDPEEGGRVHRRPRQDSPTVLTLRVDLLRAKPPIWRRVELPSTLTLDRLHDVAQVLFAWDDSHLHRFSLGGSAWDDDAEQFLCPHEVDGDVEGTPTTEVRLDEVLAEVGDRLRYVYDYGDEWTLVLRVEHVSAGKGRVRCIGGRGDHPPEDAGGVLGWDPGTPGQLFEVGAVDAALAARGL